MRAERGDRVYMSIDSRQRPQRAEHNRREREPAPQPETRQRESGRVDDGDIDIQRPEIRRGGRDQHRRQISADDAQTGERRAVEQSGAESEQAPQSPSRINAAGGGRNP